MDSESETDKSMSSLVEMICNPTNSDWLDAKFGVATQTDYRDYYKDIRIFKVCTPLEETVDKSAEQAKEQEELLRKSLSESALKNMKLESEISLDNEMLDLLGKGTPKTPTACQEGTEKTLTNLDMLDASLDLPPGGSELDIDEAIARWQQEREERQWLEELELALRLEPVIEEEEDVHATLNIRVCDGETATRVDPMAHEKSVTETVCFFSVKHLEMKSIQQKKVPIVRKHKNGKKFTVIFPDGTGHICYPSGRLAILVVVAQTDEWFCVIVLDDKPNAHIQAIFTSKGYGCCYYENGKICVNLTTSEGLYSSNTGVIKKYWKWHDKEKHVHAPPLKSINVDLNPKLNVLIKSQQHTCITFNSDKCNIQLNVGYTPKDEDQLLPKPDSFHEFLAEKTKLIKVLLIKLKSLTSWGKLAIVLRVANAIAEPLLKNDSS